jgi:glutamate/tyrosine decarboxylase-like PLP-dependent enzyme
MDVETFVLFTTSLEVLLPTIAGELERESVRKIERERQRNRDREIERVIERVSISITCQPCHRKFLGVTGVELDCMVVNHMFYHLSHL